MAQQSNDPFGLGAQWRIQQAKAGGLVPQTKPSIVDRIFNGLMMAGQFVNAADQVPANSPAIFAGLGAIGQMRNLQAFNRYQAQLEQQARMNNLAQLMQVDSQMAQAFPNGLTNDELEQALKVAATRQGALNAQLMAGGQAPIFGSAVDPAQNNAVLKDYLARQGVVSDFQAQQQLTPRVFQQGQATADPYFQFGQGDVQVPAGGAAGTPAMMSLPPEQVLQGGVSQQQQGQYQSPFFTGVIPATQYGQAFTTGADIPNQSMQRRQEQQKISIQRQQEARMERQFQEDKRQFGLNYAIAKFNADTARINANKPDGGGNPYTIPNAQQNYLQGQISALENIMEGRGYIKKNQLTGIKTWSAPKDDPTKIQEFNNLMSQWTSLNNAILGGGAPQTMAPAASVSTPQVPVQNTPTLQKGELAPGLMSPGAFKASRGRK